MYKHAWKSPKLERNQTSPSTIDNGPGQYQRDAKKAYEERLEAEIETFRRQHRRQRPKGIR